MSSFKQIARCLLVIPLLAGCHQTITHLSNDAIREPALYQPLFMDTCSGGAAHPVPSAIKGITVYRTRFEEKFVENGSVLSIASLNNRSNRPTAKYKYLQGYRQDLFLVRVEASCQPEAWIYFSVVYRPDTKRPELVQEGFGKAYIGTSNPGNGTIYFHHALSFGYDKSSGSYHLRQRGSTEFFFITDGLTADQQKVDVNRIVIEEKNKFAGPSPFVFVVSEHFRGELSRLEFKRTGS
jgi:hypothetical protein